jgi:predicted N-acetyltransferase YhbS
MELRAARRDEVFWLATLWAHAFPGETSVAERARELETGGAYGGLDEVRVAEHRGTPVGACKLYRLRQRLGGTTLPMMGLAGVAIAPEHRRGGVGRTMCREALRLGRERGDVVSTLYAFRPDYYRALGWGLTGALHVYRFHPEMLPAGEPAGVRLGTATDIRGMAECYARMLARAHGPIERTGAMWQHHLGGGRAHSFVLDEGGVRGYLLARYGPGASREQRVLHITELIADDAAAYDALVGWISRQRDLWRNVSYDAWPDEHFALRLRDPRTPGHRHGRGLWDPTARVMRGPMLRLLDVRAAFERRAEWGASPPVRFRVEPQDSELPDNNLPFEVDHDGLHTAIRDGAGTPPARLAAGAAALAQIYAGELPVSAAIRFGVAEASGNVRALDAFFAAPGAFRLLDDF